MVSLVVVLRNNAAEVPLFAGSLHTALCRACAAEGYSSEILFVDDGSMDGTFSALEREMMVLPDVRAIALVSAGDRGAAILAGMEHALGDFVVLFDPCEDSPGALEGIVTAMAGGAELALVVRPPGQRRGRAYGVLSAAFVAAFRLMVGVDLRTQAGLYRGMSQRVVKFIIVHDNAALAHRALPTLGGFQTAVVPDQGGGLLYISSGPSLSESVRRGLSLLTSTSTAPLRMTTVTCAAAASLSLAYSVYVFVVFLFSRHVEPGWTTLSLQISGMFFLLSLAVALLSEHVLMLSSSTSRKPPYHFAREARSAVLTKEAKLNVV
jgi:hypothetical protein